MSFIHDDEWKILIHQRIVELGSVQAVADEIGYARASLSLALRGKYIGSTAKLEQVVLHKYSNVQCPFLQRELSKKECLEHKNREAPTQNPAEMRFWRTCQQCALGCDRTRKK